MAGQTRQRRARVLVGVDGSPASREALVFAENEARMRKADLLVLTSVDVPDQMWLRPHADVLPATTLVGKAKERARDVIAEELGNHPGVRVQVQATTTAAAVTLVDR
jgi:nucleotide-binding universal stress UspA family protein